MTEAGVTGAPHESRSRGTARRWERWLLVSRASVAPRPATAICCLQVVLGLRGSTVATIALVIGGSLICVALSISCFELEIDSPISLQQVAHVNRAGLFLVSSFLLIQPIAAVILRHRLFSTSTAWSKLLQVAGITAACAIASFGLGILIQMLAEERWLRIALAMFS